MRSLVKFFLTALFLFTWLPTAHAQSLQGKTVRMVVAFAAGGPTDVLARLLALKLGEGLGTSVIVENRPGAGGNVGAQAVAKSAPDGQTLLLATISFVINPSLYARAGYDPIKEFTPITMVSSAPYMLLVHPSLPARSVKELVTLAQSQPGKLNYSSSGNGTAAHLAGVLFNTSARVDIAHIPYNSAAPALTALLAGDVSMLFNNPLTASAHIKSGKLRALAVTSAHRSVAAPDVPTLTEAGVPGAEVGSWTALLAPAGINRTLVTRVHSEMSRILGAADVRTQLISDGAEPIGSGPDELAAFLKSEMAKWSVIIAKSGARID